MENQTKNKSINPYLKHKPMTYGKKLYIGELIAENIIQAIAIISIGIIIAIFYYVFNESIYAFIHNEHHQTEAVNKDELSVDSYSVDSYSIEDETSETVSTAEENEFEPQTYGEPLPESRLPSAADSEYESLEYLEEVPVTISDLVLPNDTINGKPSYIWQPISQKPKFSFMPLFLGSFKVTIIGILIAAPIAILAAIFTITFASKKQKEFIKPIIEIIAGFPSVVLGFFALITLATLFQNLLGTTYRLNAFVAGVGIAIAVIPIIYTVAEDSMSFIPTHFRDASLSLGASRWQTAIRVILPAATPGIMAAIILGFGRAFGETMIVLMATGNAALMSLDIFEPVRTLSASIGAEMAEVELRSVHYGVLFLIGSVLFIFTFSLNAIAEFYVKRTLVKKIQGK